MKLYTLVSWPEIQNFMEHKNWKECIFCNEIPGHPVEDSTYAVPLNLYEEVTGKKTHSLLKDAVNWISIMTFQTSEEDNPDKLDDKLLETFNL